MYVLFHKYLRNYLFF